MDSAAGKNMLLLLKKLRLYRLEKDSLVYAELAAYDAGFALLEEYMGILYSGKALDTAPLELLPHYETMVGLRPAPQGDPAQRRKMVRARLEFAPTHTTQKQLESYLPGAGMTGKVLVSAMGGLLQINVDQLLDPARSMEEIQHYLGQVLPAHMEWKLLYGLLTFDLLEEKNINWDQWDTEDFSWNTFDTQGESLFP